MDVFRCSQPAPFPIFKLAIFDEDVVCWKASLVNAKYICAVNRYRCPVLSFFLWNVRLQECRVHRRLLGFLRKYRVWQCASLLCLTDSLIDWVLWLFFWRWQRLFQNLSGFSAWYWFRELGHEKFKIFHGLYVFNVWNEQFGNGTSFRCIGVYHSIGGISLNRECFI